jgi:hypothetical protein
MTTATWSTIPPSTSPPSTTRSWLASSTPPSIPTSSSIAPARSCSAGRPSSTCSARPPTSTWAATSSRSSTPTRSTAPSTRSTSSSPPDRAATGWVGPPLTIALRHADGHLVSCRALAVPAGDPTFDGLILQIRATETTSKLDEAISSMVSGDDLDLTIARILEFATEQMPYSIGVVGRGFDGDRFESVVADPRAPSFDEVHLPLDVDPTPWREVLDGTDLAVMDVADIAPGVGRRAERRVPRVLGPLRSREGAGPRTSWCSGAEHPAPPDPTCSKPSNGSPG